MSRSLKPLAKWGLFLVGVILIFRVTFNAGTFLARPSEDFVRTTGGPDTFNRTFTALDPGAPCTLVIYNGGSNNQYDRVSSAIITLNGTVVFGESDFNQKVSLIQKQVPLLASNTLVEVARG